MKPIFMLDTNIVSFLMKQKFPILEQRINDFSENAYCLSIITYAELCFGFRKNKERTKLQIMTEYFFSRITILPWDIKAANEYADIRANLENQGKVIGNMDMLIAAHARAENMTLITNNTREFQRVENLKIEDWTI